MADEKGGATKEWVGCVMRVLSQQQTHNTVNSLMKLGPHFCGIEQRYALKITHISEVVIPQRIVIPATNKKMRGV